MWKKITAPAPMTVSPGAPPAQSQGITPWAGDMGTVALAQGGVLTVYAPPEALSGSLSVTTGNVATLAGGPGILLTPPLPSVKPPQGMQYVGGNLGAWQVQCTWKTPGPLGIGTLSKAGYFNVYVQSPTPGSFL